MRTFISLLAAIALTGLTASYADEIKPFADAKEIDLVTMLAPGSTAIIASLAAFICVRMLRWAGFPGASLPPSS
jgi:hypothetical protein